ncbi:glycosyltransferase family 2 protein [Pseudomonas putida]|uniref:Glycosyltransferase n=1 Tax=Pseudomonas putida TaxID=303 RepID=A0A800N837_PSEPU|nr:glycosyltransferase family 2 protein [Pseudomonas putida]KAF0256965.1 glycosyltransferase [Pseudomonas putida]KWW13321.1 glycosyl transferase [Pseudomonas putida]MDF3874327.1 glycosyltransferase family 2 protein [Pseudomonas putida]MDF3878443.1 glycosyltransferase family 2 protein [Pseudomonas putida]
MTQDFLEKPQAGQPRVPHHAFKGAILALQGDVLQGWAMDTAHPDQRPIIEVFIDGASVALARADQYEPQAPVGDQFHGFAVQVRQSWLSDARVITARIANQAFALDGDIVLPTVPSQVAAAIASQVWHTGGLHVSGWSWDPQSPRRHTQVTVREGSQVICTATCNLHNQALAYRETSDHGFAIDLPWEMADGKVHVLELINDLGQPLAGSPIRLCCWPEGVGGLVRNLDPTHDATTVALLAEVAKEQALHLPKSAGWQAYPQWFEAFQRLEHIERPPMQGKVGLLLITKGDPAQEKRSLESLGDDHANLHEIITAAPDDLLPALQQLLAAGCDRILPLMAGDRLAPLALLHLCSLLDEGGAWAFADCDCDGPQSERSMPWLKPVWDIDLFIGADIFTPGAIFGADIVVEAVALLKATSRQPSINWYDLTAGIALATQNSEASVMHLPRVLYHRASHASTSPEQAAPSPQRLHAVEWLCQSLAPGSTVSHVPDYPALLRAHWPLPEKLPRVSLIVPTRDQYKLLRACVEGLLNETDYPDLEIIVVDNDSSDPETLAYFKEIKARGVTVLEHPYPFNYSTINNRAARYASGELIGLINNDIEIIQRDWLKEMVSQALRPQVGAVGAKLLWPNRMVQHGGVIIGVNGLAAHTGNNITEYDPGYLGMNHVTRRQSAVTAACLLLRKSVFDAVAGLNETLFPVAFNDVDLCLKIQKQGLHIIWSAFSKLVHAESASRGKDLTPEKRARAQREKTLFIEHWALETLSDRFYHPSLSLDFLSGPFGGLAIPPRPLISRS